MKKFFKVIIIGDACRGKSTLAEKLAVKWNIPHHQTDDFLYKVKFAERRTKQESLDMASSVYNQGKWLAEGTTRFLLKPAMESADLIIHLAHKNVLLQWILLTKRYFQRNHESEKIKRLLELMKHVFYKRYGLGYRKGQLTISEAIKPYKEKTITLSSFKDINKFLDQI